MKDLVIIFATMLAAAMTSCHIESSNTNPETGTIPTDSIEAIEAVTTDTDANAANTDADAANADADAANADAQ